MSDNTTPQETQQRVSKDRKGRKAIQKANSVLERIEIVYAPIDSVRANSYNPNRQSDEDFELLLRSIEEDGFTQPVIVTSDNIIVDGEHRWRAAQTLGMKEIPIVQVEMTEEQARISTIRHNRARGSHDVQLEASVLKDLVDLGASEWLKDSLMISDQELDHLTSDITLPEIYAEEPISEAWEPDKTASTDEIAVISTMTAGGKISSAASKDNEFGYSAKAVEEIREREKKIAEAKTREERELAKASAKLYRINLIFAGDEADLVRQVLGDNPSERILEFCKTVS